MCKPYMIKFEYLLLPFILVSALEVSAQSTDSKLNFKIREVEKAIKERKKHSRVLKKKADSLESDITKAGQDRINIAYNVQILEQRLSKLENEINDLNQAETEKHNLLSIRREQSARVLMALQRISRIPPEAIIAYPKGTDDLIRTAILLKTAIPKIERQADRLREDLTALTATRELISDRKIQLKTASLEFRKKRKYLDKLISRKARQHKTTVSKRRKATTTIQALNSKAKN